ncbi:MAG: thiamine phosphate synthase [Moraxellaceae bacterium]|nr:thiamine phosphate synthase [Moraxellaceae bacterium]
MSNKQGVYVITDSALLQGRLVASVEAALQGGAQIVQYRDKSSDSAKRLHHAQQLKQLCQHYNIPLIINDDLELAAQLDVGVHLGQQDGSITLARQRLGAKAIIGATCHNSLEFAQQAAQQGASYLAFGAFYPSSTKPLAQLAQLDTLTQAKHLFNLPVVAIGGITLDNAMPLINAGANYVAVISDIFARPVEEIRQRTQSFNQLFM